MNVNADEGRKGEEGQEPGIIYSAVAGGNSMKLKSIAFYATSFSLSTVAQHYLLNPRMRSLRWNILRL